jgi:PAS domain S-box-containing protein
MEKNNRLIDNNDFSIPQEMIQILDAFYDGIWITDSDGRILYINRANEDITGLKREDALGKTTQELLEKKLFSNSAVLEVLKTQKRVTMMGYNYVTEKHALITANPIFDKDGNLKFVANNVRDITELEKISKHLRKKKKIIDSQQKEIEKLKALNFDASFLKSTGIVANSPKMQQVFDLAQRVGRFDSTVLITGESGSGKEVVAESIVRASDREAKPFIKVNCGAIPENLLESEFFGYEKGAFTGADPKGKAGLFEMANGGTIFLDEIGELPLNLQVKILRVLQQKELVRIGGAETISLDVRVISATNKNVEQMVSEGTFRKDLFYRLNVVSIIIPPLRERTDDILPLLTVFLDRFNSKYKLQKKMTPAVLDAFVEYTWPGNVRELENVVESMVVLSPDEMIGVESMPAKVVKTGAEEKPAIDIKEIMPMKEAVSLLEESLLQKAMEKYGTTRKAAQALKVDQSTVVRKLQKYNSDVLYE